jgi:hypothetical protein
MTLKGVFFAWRKKVLYWSVGGAQVELFLRRCKTPSEPR